MSVIVGRALPDARDGLKPVHRRVLYAMHELNNDWNRAYKKSARIVGDVIGKYHPHGDSRSTTRLCVWRKTFRCATCWSMAKATSARSMATTPLPCDTPRSAGQDRPRMLEDIDKDTVDFGPNYDGSEKEPLVMPTRMPNLFINGSGVLRWAWPPTFRHTTSTRWWTAACTCSSPRPPLTS
jgi:DNA gyrase subunit A